MHIATKHYWYFSTQAEEGEKKEKEEKKEKDDDKVVATKLDYDTPSRLMLAYVAQVNIVVIDAVAVIQQESLIG